MRFVPSKNLKKFLYIISKAPVETEAGISIYLKKHSLNFSKLHSLNYFITIPNLYKI